jgi:membrane associated rhomboid family serine protease
LAVVAWLGVIASPILAFILLSYETPYAYADDDWFTRHPLAISGITLAAIGVFQSLAMIMISGFIKSQIAFQAHLGGIVAGLQTARPEDFR